MGRLNIDPGEVINIRQNKAMTTYEKTTTTTFKVGFASFNVFTYNSQFRKIRASHHDKLSKCHMCDGKFNDGDQFALIGTNRGNKVMHNVCAADLVNLPEEKRALIKDLNQRVSHQC